MTLDDLMAEAVSHHRAGRLADAERIYRAILEQVPAHPDANHNLGVMAMQVGRVEQGFPYFKAALDAAPQREQFWLSTLDALLAADRVEEAEIGLEQGRARGLSGDGFAELAARIAAARRAEASFAAAAEHHAAGRREPAIAGYREAVALRPAFAAAHLRLGYALLDGKRLDEAEASFRAAIRLRPDHAEAWYGLGRVLDDAGRPEDAVIALRRCAELQPDMVNPHYVLGLILTRLERTAEAEDALRQAIRLQPDHADAWFDLGRVLDIAGRFGDAADAMMRCAELQPDRAEAHYALGKFLARLGRLSEAAQSAGRAVAIRPDSAEFLLLLGSLDVIRCRRDQAVPRFARAIALTSARHEVEDRIEGLDRAAGLIPIGRAASLFFHSLLDGHPEVSTVPGVYLRGWFDPRVWERLRPDFASPDWRRDFARTLLENFAPLFDAQSRGNVPGKPFGDAKWLAASSGFTEMGAGRDLSFAVDRGAFEAALLERLAPLERISVKDGFKLFHQAFDRAVGRRGSGKLLFHHIHNPNVLDMGGFLHQFPRTKVLFLARNPVQALEAWMLKHLGSEHAIPLERWSLSLLALEHMLFCLQPVLSDRAEMRCVRLEDIKRDPHQVMPRIAGWLGLEDDPALYRSEFCGLQYWGPSSHETRPITGFSTAAISQRIGKIFGPRDILIFETLFWPYSRRLGYSDWDEAEFKARLREVRPWLDQPLQFERLFHARMPKPRPELEAIPAVRWLHAVLKSYFEVLDRDGGYSGLIQPLPLG